MSVFSYFIIKGNKKNVIHDKRLSEFVHKNMHIIGISRMDFVWNFFFRHIIIKYSSTGVICLYREESYSIKLNMLFLKPCVFFFCYVWSSASSCWVQFYSSSERLDNRNKTIFISKYKNFGSKIRTFDSKIHFRSKM